MLSRTQKKMNLQSLRGTNRVAATLSGNPQCEHAYALGVCQTRFHFILRDLHVRSGRQV